MAEMDILIVEDNPINLKLVKLLMMAEHYKVHTAVDAEDALRVLSTVQPQIILMDIQLPGKNGLELTRALKSDPRYKDIIIIALTAYAMKGDEAKAKAAGCDGYLTKPISVETFTNEIAKYLNAKSDVKKKIVIKKAHILIIEDNPISNKFLRKCLESEDYTVVSVADGASALNAVKTLKFDLIIQDLFLPDIDGFTLNKQIRALPGGQGIPIFALSGFLNQLHKDTDHTGFTTFLLKPIETSYLLDVIRAHLPMAISSKASLGNGKHILIADDNTIQLKLFSMQLKNAGFKVTTAVDGVTALQEAHKKKPDAIISDILMPNMDGFSLCSEIKRDKNLCTIPVILLTSHYLENEDLELAKKVGASCYLTRTPDEEKLILELLNILKKESTSTGDTPLILTEEIKEKHTIRSIRQLEQQVVDNAKLAQRCAMLVSQLSLISGIADALTSSSKAIDKSLKEALYLCLDATGIAKGALYLNKGNNLALSQLIGFTNDQKEKIQSFFKSSDLIPDIIKTNKPFAIPSKQFRGMEVRNFLDDIQIKSGVFIPLFFNKECLGLLFFGSDLNNLFSENINEFIQALGVQLGQSIALASAFEKLFYSEKRYRQLVEISPDAIFIIQDEQFVFANQAATALLHAHRAEDLMLGSIYEFFPRNYQLVIKDNLAKSSEEILISLHDGKIITLNSEVLDVEITVSHFIYNGLPAVYMIIRDITERAQTTLQLEIQYAIAWILAESATLYVATAKILKIVCERLNWDWGSIWAVDKTENILRCSRIWQTSQIPDNDLLEETKQLTCLFGDDLPGLVWQERKAIWKQDVANDDIFMRKSAALKIGIKTALAFPIIYENEVLGVIEFFSRNDIHPKYDLLLWFESIGNQLGLFLKRKHMEKQMLHLAEHDVLTGLSNRNLLEQYIQTSIASAKETNQKLAVLFLDIDHFKYVNDSLGHQTGDLLLKEIASRLLQCLRPQDIVSRMGGDEFVIVLPNISGDKEIITVIERLQQKLKDHFLLKNKEFKITISIGISRYPEDGDKEIDLIKCADIAMYVAKEKGRNNYQFCTSDMTKYAENKGILQNDLRAALENNEFILFYQPKIDISTQKIVGMEALIRWKKNNELIMPAHFISTVEDCDLIIPVSHWALKTACQQTKDWQDAGLPNITMSVNLSVRNLNQNLLQGIPPIIPPNKTLIEPILCLL